MPHPALTPEQVDALERIKRAGIVDQHGVPWHDFTASQQGALRQLGRVEKVLRLIQWTGGPAAFSRDPTRCSYRLSEDGKRWALGMMNVDVDSGSPAG